MDYNFIVQWSHQFVKTGKRPLVLGINGPQGSGKSTLSRFLCEQLERPGLRAVSISIDDFYLTRAEQVKLATAYAKNPYLQQRGYPGTHDIELGLRVLNELISAESGSVAVPRYDKSAFQGQGDRLPESQWSKIAAPVDLIVVEGWMLGFTPVSLEQLPNGHFTVINEFLHKYESWYRLLDGFIQLKPNDYRNVVQWRVEAEEKMKAEGKPGMTIQEVTRYAELFLPAYATYLPQLSKKPPTKNTLIVPIGLGRLPRT